MPIDDKIKDKKQQYDINREEAKIWALSSGKIDKCEYLTGQEKLPSAQKTVIEQAKFTYSPSGKAWEGQGKKHIKAIENHGKQLIMSTGEKDSLALLKQKEIFDELVNERRLESNRLSEGIDFNN